MSRKPDAPAATARIDVLVEVEGRQHQHPGASVRSTIMPRGLDPVHPGIRTSITTTSGRTAGWRLTASAPSAAVADHLEVILDAEDGGEAVAHHRLVVGDHDLITTRPRQSAALRVHPEAASSSARRSKVPPTKDARSAIPDRPWPGTGVVDRRAVVLDVHLDRSLAVRQPHSRRRARGVPGHVGQRLLDDPVRGQRDDRCHRSAASPRTS